MHEVKIEIDFVEKENRLAGGPASTQAALSLFDTSTLPEGVLMEPILLLRSPADLCIDFSLNRGEGHVFEALPETPGRPQAQARVQFTDTGFQPKEGVDEPLVAARLEKDQRKCRVYWRQLPSRERQISIFQLPVMEENLARLVRQLERNRTDLRAHHGPSATTIAQQPVWLAERLEELLEERNRLSAAEVRELAQPELIVDPTIVFEPDRDDDDRAGPPPGEAP